MFSIVKRIKHFAEENNNILGNLADKFLDTAERYVCLQRSSEVNNGKRYLKYIDVMSVYIKENFYNLNKLL